MDVCCPACGRITFDGVELDALRMKHGLIFECSCGIVSSIEISFDRVEPKEDDNG